jgi:glycosyltransferase involved in cell wall biosynthesis
VPRKTRTFNFTGERLRQIAWEAGKRYPIPLSFDCAALYMVRPRLGHVHWNMTGESAARLMGQTGWQHGAAHPAVRVHDVTDVIFDGSNSHGFFDLPVGSLSGNYYFGVDHMARDYLAEAGLKAGGEFRPLARSGSVRFDRDRPSGNYNVAGMFVGGSLGKAFPVENVFDAPVYERMNRELAGLRRKEALHAAVVFLRIDEAGVPEGPLVSFVRELSRRMEKFGAEAELFSRPVRLLVAVKPGTGGSLSRFSSLAEDGEALSAEVAGEVAAAHGRRPFHLIHCHDWYSSPAGLAAARDLGLPLALSLHSTEHERAHGRSMDALSTAICEIENAAVSAADLVIVPHSSTRQQVLNLYGAAPEKVVIIPDALSEGSQCSVTSPSEVKKWFGLNPGAPMALFAGEMSHAAGADLMVEALPTVCRNHPAAQFVFAGDGPLKGELESRAWHLGIGHRCRFLGDVAKETFDALLMASEFVVIPARTWQDEGLAQAAIGCGRPVLTTRQAGINCVVHGQNGLVTFDNPGSIVWGIQELLSNPLQGSMLRIVARRSAAEAPSLENVAAQHYIHYELLLKGLGGGAGA